MTWFWITVAVALVLLSLGWWWRRQWVAPQPAAPTGLSAAPRAEDGAAGHPRD